MGLSLQHIMEYLFNILLCGFLFIENSKCMYKSILFSLVYNVIFPSKALNVIFNVFGWMKCRSKCGGGTWKVPHHHIYPVFCDNRNDKIILKLFDLSAVGPINGTPQKKTKNKTKTKQEQQQNKIAPTKNQ